MKLVFIVFASILSLNAFAVDGYKDVKFGSDIKIVKDKKLCSISSKPSIEDGIAIYHCDDFKFNGKKTTAYFYFIDSKLMRLAFIAGGGSELSPLVSTLKDKYGVPSTPVTKEIGAAYDAGRINSFDVGFDKDTVVVRAVKKGSEDHILMLYSSESYDKKLQDQQKRGMASDL